MDPFYIVSDLSERTGGIVAGGCIRDITLGVAPKDYDVFFSDTKHLEKICREWQSYGFEYQPHSATDNKSYGKYGSVFWVFNTKYKGQRVQLIYGQHIKHTKSDPIEIVETFPFTVNQMYYDRKKGIQMTEAAKTALFEKKIILNRTHRSAWTRPVSARQWLASRAFYLANKLEFSVPIATLDGLFESYPTRDYAYANHILTPPEGEEGR